MNEVTPVVTLDLMPVFAALLAYFGMILAIAGALQAIIAKLTVPILEPIKGKLSLDDKGYQVLVDVTMFFLAVLTMLFTPSFSLLNATLAPALALSPVTVPAFSLGAMHVLWLVAGQDLVKGVITKLTEVQGAFGALLEIDPTADDPRALGR